MTETYRVRLRFSKDGDLRLVGHRDLVRLVERLFRRAGIAVAESQGFHPKPRMMFASALALGVAGRDELLEVDLREPLATDLLVERLNAHSQPGLVFHAAEVVPPGTKSAQPIRQTFELCVPAERQAEIAERIVGMLADPDTLISKGEDATPQRLHDFLEELSLNGQTLRIKLRISPSGGVRPRDVLSALGIAEPQAQQYGLVRLALEVPS